MKLKVMFDSEEIKSKYNNINNSRGDSGFDLYVVDDIVIPGAALAIKLDFKIKCEPGGNHGYDLVPRSSICKTPLRMSNSIGIIDQGYRGNIIGTVDNMSSKDYTLKSGTRIFQIVMPDRGPIDIEIVDKLTETERGENGFGSTGK